MAVAGARWSRGAPAEGGPERPWGCTTAVCVTSMPRCVLGLVVVQFYPRRDACACDFLYTDREDYSTEYSIESNATMRYV